MQIPRENRDRGNKIILLLIIVSVQEENIKTVGYDFEQVVGTTVYSLTDQKIVLEVRVRWHQCHVVQWCPATTTVGGK